MNYSNPRAPQGARPGTALLYAAKNNFNPRAPQGARHRVRRFRRSILRFQSTRSARSATSRGQYAGAGGRISIHALRKERDRRLADRAPCPADFNPRAPQGARHQARVAAAAAKIFQSTRSARSATCPVVHELGGEQISIHALRKERDSKSGHKRSLLRCIHNDYSQRG